MSMKKKIKTAVQIFLLFSVMLAGFWSIYGFIWSNLGLPYTQVVALLLAVFSLGALCTSVGRA